MLLELAQHLNSASNVDALVLQLKCAPLMTRAAACSTARGWEAVQASMLPWGPLRRKGFQSRGLGAQGDNLGAHEEHVHIPRVLWVCTLLSGCRGGDALQGGSTARGATAVSRRQLKSRGGAGGGQPASPAEKQALWRELAAAGFARAAAAVWLMPLLNLLLRVQLNILGRHLFLESNLLDPRRAAPTWLDSL